MAVGERRMSPLSLPRPSASQSRAGDVRIPAASSNPFLVNVLPSYMRKPPSLEECEVVIRQLWNINHMQMQEVRPLPTGVPKMPWAGLREGSTRAVFSSLPAADVLEIMPG